MAGLTARAARAPIVGEERASTMTKIVPGAKVGDFVIGPAMKTSTSDVHDSVVNEERNRREEEDQHAAEHGLGAPTPGREAPTEPTEGEKRAGADIDASIAAAREGDQPEMPIFLTDPLTGKPIGRI
ncbi:MAG: hypothetical protein ABJE95_21155 [Byssovorax sp.]